MYRVSQVLAAVSCLVAAIVLVFQYFRPHGPLFVNAAVEEKTEE